MEIWHFSYLYPALFIQVLWSLSNNYLKWQWSYDEQWLDHYVASMTPYSTCPEWLEAWHKIFSCEKTAVEHMAFKLQRTKFVFPTHEIHCVVPARSFTPSVNSVMKIIGGICHPQEALFCSRPTNVAALSCCFRLGVRVMLHYANKKQWMDMKANGLKLHEIITSALLLLYLKVTLI